MRLPIILTIMMTIILTGCTYSITMVHTEGQATDVVDTDQKPTTDVSPTVSIPAAAL